MMRLSKYKLVAASLVSVVLVALAGFGTYSALGQRPDLPRTETASAPIPADQKNQPTISPSGDSITAYPDLDPKSLEDLVTMCPKTLGGKEIPLAPNDPPLLQLQKAKLNASLANLTRIIERLKIGELNDALAIPDACNRSVAAAIDVFPASELRTWYEERVRVAKWYEKVIAAQIKAGTRTNSDLHVARYDRLDAEISLLKLTSRKDAGGGR